MGTHIRHFIFNTDIAYVTCCTPLLFLSDRVQLEQGDNTLYSILCHNVYVLIYCPYKKVSEYDQEIPQSHPAYHRAFIVKYICKTIIAKQPALSSPSR